MLDDTLAAVVTLGTDSPGGQPVAGGELATVGGAIQRYLAYRGPSIARATARSLRETLFDLSRTVGPDLPIQRLSERQISKWLASRPIRPSSMRVRVGIVRGFTTWCAREKLTRKDIGRYLVSPRAPQAMPREIDPDAVRKLFRTAPDPRGQLILSLMVQEGLRRAEVARLDVGDLDRAERVMLVHGKNSKERWLPVSDETWACLTVYLRTYPASSGPLIRSYTEPNKGLSPTYISVLVSQWMRDAGVKETAFDGVSAHALRHTFAGALLDEGADVRDVQDALGHADLSATYRYLKRRRATGKLREVMGRRTYLD